MSTVDLSALRLWLLASQILLASGVVAVVIGAVGTVRFSAARERLAVAEAVKGRPPAHPAAPAPDPAEIAALKAQTETLKTQLAAAQHDLKAATATEDRLAAAAPRALTDSQKTRLLAALKAIPGPPNVDLFTLSDPEAAAYGDQFVKLFDAAAYHGQARNIGAPSPLPRGLRLTLKPGAARGAAIKYAFEAVGLPVIVTSGDTGAFDILITVGAKP